ncbi:hypothetical protein BH23ACT6_BH23ACT6_26560 [soil metagenome]
MLRTAEDVGDDHYVGAASFTVGVGDRSPHLDRGQDALVGWHDRTIGGGCLAVQAGNGCPLQLSP